MKELFKQLNFIGDAQEERAAVEVWQGDEVHEEGAALEAGEGDVGVQIDILQVPESR